MRACLGQNREDGSGKGRDGGLESGCSAERQNVNVVAKIVEGQHNRVASLQLSNTHSSSPNGPALHGRES